MLGNPVMDVRIHAVDRYLHHVEVDLLQHRDDLVADQGAVGQNIDAEIIIPGIDQHLGKLFMGERLSTREGHADRAHRLQLILQVPGHAQRHYSHFFRTGQVAVQATLVAVSGNLQVHTENDRMVPEVGIEKIRGIAQRRIFILSQKVKRGGLRGIGQIGETVILAIQVRFGSAGYQKALLCQFLDKFAEIRSEHLPRDIGELCVKFVNNLIDGAGSAVDFR